MKPRTLEQRDALLYEGFQDFSIYFAYFLNLTLENAQPWCVLSTLNPRRSTRLKDFLQLSSILLPLNAVCGDFNTTLNLLHNCRQGKHPVRIIQSDSLQADR
jgi:hypothetical protein